MAETLHPVLQDLKNQFDRAEESVRNLAGSLNDKQFNWQPVPGKWSVGQHVQHLNQNLQWYLPFVDDALEHGKGTVMASSEPFMGSFIGAKLVATVEPPVKARFKAPKHLQPPPRIDPKKTMDDFFALQEQWRERLRRSSGLDAGRIKLRSPITKWLRLPLWQIFALESGHERRHLWHAWQVRNNPQFPDVV